MGKLVRYNIEKGSTYCGKALLSDLEPGDTLIINSLRNVCRSTADMLDLVISLSEKGCYIKSIEESWLDTSNTQESQLDIFRGIRQFGKEVRQRAHATGVTLAKEKGVTFGRPELKAVGIDQAIELYKKGDLTVTQICEAVGISRTTLWRRLKKANLINK